jgi:SAM-dependent methyltransferase
MSASLRDRLLACSFAAAILLGAFLVFQVQLVVGKFILPWFGGTPAVWTTCMLFFQVGLFAGYAYAHFSIARLRPATQGLLHLTLIFLAIGLLPITPSPDWKAQANTQPIAAILGMLSICVGFPYVVLSATGPLLQAWFSRAYPDRSPYRLYALSNVGSLLGLVSYPSVVEPALPVTAQAQWWTFGFTVFALCCGYCSLKAWKRPAVAWSAIRSGGTPQAFVELSNGPRGAPPTPRRRVLWLGLAACASWMLLATTNHVCQDVAVVPFLWVAPLTLYLISFIICFDRENWYSRRWFAGGAVVFLVATAGLSLRSGATPLLLEAGTCFAALFFVCMVCHGELVRWKPDPRHLTSFYLMCSAGGALGGLLVAVAAPLMFATHAEFPLGLLVCYLIALIALAHDAALRRWLCPPRRAWTAGLLACLGLLPFVRCQTAGLGGTLLSTRNFYGVLHVDAIDRDDPWRQGRALRYGRIVHGFQFLAPQRKAEPTLYYGPTSGVGIALRSLPNAGPRRIGIVGLGVGTLAAYGRAGDYLRFYEINPDVLRIARDQFTFLSDSPAAIEVALGDARLSLEREQPQQFDLLALDAFSGDALPTHLLTREAFAIYRRHLRPDGVLAIHITNRHLDLTGVLARLAEDAQWRAEAIEVRGTRPEEGVVPSLWMVLSNNGAFWGAPDVRGAIGNRPREYAHIPLWTDDYSNVLQAMR